MFFSCDECFCRACCGFDTLLTVLHARTASRPQEVFVSEGVTGRLAKRVALPISDDMTTPPAIIDTVSGLFGAECRFVCEAQKDGTQVELPSVLYGGEKLMVEYKYWDVRLRVSSMQDSVRSAIATFARTKGLDGFCSRSDSVAVDVAIFSVKQDQINEFLAQLPDHLTQCDVEETQRQERWGVLQGHFVHHKQGVSRESGNSPDNESATSGATGMSAAAMSIYT